MKAKATDDQLREALATMTVAQTAAHFGMNERTVWSRKAKLALHGHIPEMHIESKIPSFLKIKGTSQLMRRGESEPLLSWVKTNTDGEALQAMVEASCAAAVKDLPHVPARSHAGSYLPDLMTAYPIGDPHFGEYIWAEECGADWDLSIAEQTHCAAMASLVESAPPTETAIIVNLGDAAHYDSMAAITPRSGHHLDADSRYAKMVDILILAMRQCVESALSKHKFVHVVHVIGNHDETGAVWLSRLFAHLYANEPRVTVETSPSVFSYYRWGKNLIGMHHGHTSKAEKLPGVMATDRARDWGETLHRYWWTGHIHHESKKEYPGCTVESFNTLAPGDSYAHAGGWRSRQNMKAIVLHKEHGEVARHTVHPAMLKGSAA
jgi:hypothetical protein